MQLHTNTHGYVHAQKTLQHLCSQAGQHIDQLFTSLGQRRCSGWASLILSYNKCTHTPHHTTKQYASTLHINAMYRVWLHGCTGWNKPMCPCVSVNISAIFEEQNVCLLNSGTSSCCVVDPVFAASHHQGAHISLVWLARRVMMALYPVQPFKSLGISRVHFEFEEHFQWKDKFRNSKLGWIVWGLWHSPMSRQLSTRCTVNC